MGFSVGSALGGPVYDAIAGRGGDDNHYQMSKKKLAARAQDRLALADLMGGQGIPVDKARRRVEDAGLSTTGGDAYAYLARLAAKGGVAGKKAKLYTQFIAMNNVDKWGEEAASAGQDDIAKAYQNMTDQFTANLGPGVDMSSPAVLDAVRRYVEGRSTSSAQYTHAIEGQTMQAKNAILLNQIAPTLDETGSLVESLQMLKDEQDALRRAQYTNLGLAIGGMGLKASGVGGYGAPSA